MQYKLVKEWLVRVKVDPEFLSKGLPELEKAIGSPIEQAWWYMTASDASLCLGPPWRWIPKVQAYLWTPLHLPQAYHYRQLMMAWTPGYGWVMTIPDDGIGVWAPLFAPEDPRNRPDKVLLAAHYLVGSAGNERWLDVRRYLKEKTYEQYRSAETEGSSPP